MRFAVISDIHFGGFSRTIELSVPGETIVDESSGGCSLLEGLKHTLKKNGINYLFIAGDLTTVGSPQEFYYCEEKIIEIAEAAGVPKENIICGVGNHDIDRNISKLVNNITTDKSSPELVHLIKDHYQYIAANAAQLNLNKIHVPDNGPVPFSGFREDEKFITFILNTSLLCSHDQKIPHGKLSKEQLDWFEKIAKEKSSDSRTKIVLMHHHPMNYAYPSPSFDASMIEEGCELLDIAGKYGINLIIHGHRHHPTALTRMEEGWKHPIAFLCAGSLSVNAKHRAYGEIPNTLHIIEIKNPEEIVLFNYSFSSAEGWKPVEVNTRSIPLEKEMWLGKVFNDADVDSILKQYSGKTHILKWDTLEHPLKYMKMTDLNNKLKSYYKDHIVSGEFPNDVIIMPKSEAGV